MEHIGFKKKERRGIMIIFMVLLLLHISSFWLQPKKEKLSKVENLLEIMDASRQDEVIPKAALVEWVDSTIQRKKAYQNKKETKIKYHKLNREYFLFDPNLIDSSDLNRLGFKYSSIRNLLKYRRSGGRMHSCDELYKIYGIDSILVDTLLKYCHCKDSSPVQYPKSSGSSAMININTADSTSLRKIYGIGAKLSGRILRYRNNLGGFHQIQQLLEVYGVAPELLVNNKNRIQVSGPLKKINVNTSDFRTLSHHYYIDSKIANTIVKYREQHGKYTGLNELKNIKILNDSIFNKISPYLAVD